MKRKKEVKRRTGERDAREGDVREGWRKKCQRLQPKISLKKTSFVEFLEQVQTNKNVVTFFAFIKRL